MEDRPARDATDAELIKAIEVIVDSIQVDGAFDPSTWDGSLVGHVCKAERAIGPGVRIQQQINLRLYAATNYGIFNADLHMGVDEIIAALETIRGELS